jgi:hypothetical protein
MAKDQKTCKKQPAKKEAVPTKRGAKKEEKQEIKTLSSDIERLEAAATAQAKRPLGRPKRSQEEQDEEDKEEEKKDIDIDVPTEVEYSKDATGELEMLAMNCDWDAVLDLVRRDPKQAGILSYDDKSETALHWAAYGDAPLPVLKALVQAAPHTVAFNAGWHCQGSPMGILLNNRLLQPDIMEKVLVLLRGDHQGGKTSLFGLYAYGLRNVIREALQKYPAGTDMPETGPFSFVDDTRSEEDKAYTTLTTKEIKDVMWDIFSTVVKAGHYKTTENMDKLPLLPAIMLFEGDLPDDEEGIINYDAFPKDAIDLAMRLSINQGAMQDSSDGQYFLHKAISKRRRAMDNGQIMTMFGHHPALLTHRDVKSGLYPFLLAATPTVGDKDVREERVGQILAKRMVEWRSKATESLVIDYLDDEDFMDDEDFELYLEEWVINNSEDLHEDLFCNAGDESSCETAYEEAEREKGDIENCFDLTYRILRECPEVLQTMATVSDDAAATTNSDMETTTHKKENVEDGVGSKQHRM